MKTILIFISLLTYFVEAQVGINTETPEEMLDINGRVRVADSENVPAEGAIRYNGDFQGFDGNQWNSFTDVSKTLGFPSNPVLVKGQITVDPANRGTLTFATYPFTVPFEQIPADKILLITEINMANMNTPTY